MWEKRGSLSCGSDLDGTLCCDSFAHAALRAAHRISTPFAFSVLPPCVSRIR